MKQRLLEQLIRLMVLSPGAIAACLQDKRLVDAVLLILSNSQLFSGFTIEKTLSMLMQAFFHDPSSIASMTENNIVPTALRCINRDTMLNSSLVAAIPSFLSAVCLDAASQSLIGSTGTLKSLLNVISEANVTLFSADGGINPGHFGASMEEMVRHTPFMKDAMIEDLKVFIDRVLQRANESSDVADVESFIRFLYHLLEALSNNSEIVTSFVSKGGMRIMVEGLVNSPLSNQIICSSRVSRLLSVIQTSSVVTSQGRHSVLENIMSHFDRKMKILSELLCAKRVDALSTFGGCLLDLEAILLRLQRVATLMQASMPTASIKEADAIVICRHYSCISDLMLICRFSGRDCRAPDNIRSLCVDIEKSLVGVVSSLCRVMGTSYSRRQHNDRVVLQSWEIELCKLIVNGFMFECQSMQQPPNDLPTFRKYLGKLFSFASSVLWDEGLKGFHSGLLKAFSSEIIDSPKKTGIEILMALLDYVVSDLTACPLPENVELHYMASEAFRFMHKLLTYKMVVPVLSSASTEVFSAKECTQMAKRIKAATARALAPIVTMQCIGKFASETSSSLCSLVAALMEPDAELPASRQVAGDFPQMKEFEEMGYGRSDIELALAQVGPDRIKLINFFVANEIFPNHHHAPEHPFSPSEPGIGNVVLFCERALSSGFLFLSDQSVVDKVFITSFHRSLEALVSRDSSKRDVVLKAFFEGANAAAVQRCYSHFNAIMRILYLFLDKTPQGHLKRPLPEDVCRLTVAHFIDMSSSPAVPQHIDATCLVLTDTLWHIWRADASVDAKTFAELLKGSANESHSLLLATIQLLGKTSSNDVILGAFGLLDVLLSDFTLAQFLCSTRDTPLSFLNRFFETSLFAGQGTLVVRILRRIVEDPVTLRTQAEAEIRTVVASFGADVGRSVALSQIVSRCSAMLSRSYHAFIQALEAVATIDTSQRVTLIDRRQSLGKSKGKRGQFHRLVCSYLVDTLMRFHREDSAATTDSSGKLNSVAFMLTTMTQLIGSCPLVSSALVKVGAVQSLSLVRFVLQDLIEFVPAESSNATLRETSFRASMLIMSLLSRHGEPRRRVLQELATLIESCSGEKRSDLLKLRVLSNLLSTIMTRQPPPVTQDICSNISKVQLHKSLLSAIRRLAVELDDTHHVANGLLKAISNILDVSTHVPLMDEPSDPLKPPLQQDAGTSRGPTEPESAEVVTASESDMTLDSDLSGRVEAALVGMDLDDGRGEGVDDAMHEIGAESAGLDSSDEPLVREMSGQSLFGQESFYDMNMDEGIPFGEAMDDHENEEAMEDDDDDDEEGEGGEEDEEEGEEEEEEEEELEEEEEEDDDGEGADDGDDGDDGDAMPEDMMSDEDVADDGMGHPMAIPLDSGMMEVSVDLDDHGDEDDNVFDAGDRRRNGRMPSRRHLDMMAMTEDEFMRRPRLAFMNRDSQPYVMDPAEESANPSQPASQPSSLTNLFEVPSLNSFVDQAPPSAAPAPSRPRSHYQPISSLWPMRRRERDPPRRFDVAPLVENVDAAMLDAIARLLPSTQPQERPQPSNASLSLHVDPIVAAPVPNVQMMSPALPQEELPQLHPSSDGVVFDDEDDDALLQRALELSMMVDGDGAAAAALAAPVSEQERSQPAAEGFVGAANQIEQQAHGAAASTVGDNVLEATPPASRDSTATVAAASVDPVVEEWLSLGLDPSTMMELPEEIRNEVVASTRARVRAVRSADIPGIDPEVFAALPPELQAEIARQHAPQPAPQSAAQEMDPASFIATLDPHLRAEVLLGADQELLSSLPPELATEAARLRDRAAARLVDVQEMRGLHRFPNVDPSMLSMNMNAIHSFVRNHMGPHAAHHRQPVVHNGPFLSSKLFQPSDLCVLLRLLCVCGAVNRQTLSRSLQHFASREDSRQLLVVSLVKMAVGSSLTFSDPALDAVADTSGRNPVVARRALATLGGLLRQSPNLALLLLPAPDSGLNAVLALLEMFESPMYLRCPPLLEELVNVSALLLGAASRAEASSPPPLRHFLFQPACVRALALALTNEDLPEKSAAKVCSILCHVSRVCFDEALRRLLELFEVLAGVVVVQLRTLSAQVSEGTNPNFIGLPGAHDVHILRVLKCIAFIVNDVDGSAVPTQHPPSLPESGPFRSRIEPIFRDVMWEVLSDVLTRIGEQRRPAGGRHSLGWYIPVLFRLVPLLEGFLIVHGAANVKEFDPLSRAASRSDSSAPPSPMDRAASDRDLPLLVAFAERNRDALNELVKQYPTLLTGPLQALSKMPRLLDFENKRLLFRRELRKRSEGVRHTTVRLQVRRSHILEDTFVQFSRVTTDNLRGRISVSFQGEEGIDAGGLTREWYLLLSKAMMNPEIGLFALGVRFVVSFLTLQTNGQTLQPNTGSYIVHNHLQYFRFIGSIMGKAIADNQLLDAHLSRSLYKQMINMPLTYHDVESIDPTFYKSLRLDLVMRPF